MEIKKRDLENIKKRAVTISEKAEELVDQLDYLIEEDDWKWKYQ